MVCLASVPLVGFAWTSKSSIPPKIVGHWFPTTGPLVAKLVTASVTVRLLHSRQASSFSVLRPLQSSFALPPAPVRGLYLLLGFQPFSRLRRLRPPSRGVQTPLRSVLRLSQPFGGLLRFRFAGLFHPAVASWVLSARLEVILRSLDKLHSCIRRASEQVERCHSAQPRKLGSLR